jgi:signal transduction histidine kinase
MSNSILLNWAMMAVSFFNTILLLWLGVTVLLNAERRDWGMGLATTGLLLGGAFFVSHTAILGLFIGGHMVSGYTAIISEGLLVIGRNMIFWWTAGLIPAIILPFAWYLIMLWYGGFWNERDKQSKSWRPLRSLQFNSPSLYERQRILFWLVVGLLVSGLVGLGIGIILLAIPSPELIVLRVFIRWSIAGIPFMALAYSAYVVLCITLSLDALRRPGPTPRLMGNEARQRARPYLIGASFALLLVSFLVAGILLWAVQSTRTTFLYDFYDDAIETLAWFDLLIAAIIGVVILLLGQAVVSYEVFTGKPLPRHGLMRHWRRAILLAAGYSIPVGFSIAFALRPLYSLLLTTVLMTLFFALWSWQSYAERERYIDSLRPFLTSQRLTEQLLKPTPSAPVEIDIMPPFRALCGDLLDARLAYLAAVGSLAPLVGPPLVYPENEQRPLPPLADLIHQFRASQTPQTVDPAIYGGAIWAVPLWSERGLIGIFLLGPKWGNGLYTQEEIDVARVSGERLIDTKASAEMAHRLMVLQRERLAQTQIVDQQTRRVLHDDILPEIQMAIIALGGETGRSTAVAQAVETLTGAHRQISSLLREMPTTKAPEVARLGLMGALQQTVELEFAPAFDAVAWQINLDAAKKAAAIPSLTAEVVFYAAREAVRNAAKYGRGEGQHAMGQRPFNLTIALTWQNGLHLQIEDNGVGMMAEAHPQGNGQGLALHTTMMAVIGGDLTTESVPGKFTRVSLSIAGNR